MTYKIPFSRFTVTLGILLLMTAGYARVWGQTNAAMQVPRSSNAAMPTAQTWPQQQVVTAYRQTLATLSAQEYSLESSGASAAQVSAWEAQNAALFAAQQQRLQTIASFTTNTVSTTLLTPRLPPNASTDLVNFLNSQAHLRLRAEQFAAQSTAQTSPASGQISTGTQSATTGQAATNPAMTFEQQNAAEIQAQAQRVQRMLAIAASTPVSLPPSPVLPSTLPANVRTFLTLRAELMSSRLAVYNQYLNADPATRQAAEENWEAQNASLLNQEQELAAQLMPNQ